ncbi:MAG: hypothetical protein CM1200mP2_19630 [Planctomycetaceae bacterium]|nr:MAG: hypothetical protein CM1200mP2_19630 [Planctomycetaceae bacterium]
MLPGSPCRGFSKPHAQHPSRPAPLGRDDLPLWWSHSARALRPQPGTRQGNPGSFSPISTALPGVQFCKLLPRLSATAKRFSVVRTLTGMQNRHESFQCYSGRPGGRKATTNPPGAGRPSVRSRRGSWDQAGGCCPMSTRRHRSATAPTATAAAERRAESWPGFTGLEHILCFRRRHQKGPGAQRRQQNPPGKPAIALRRSGDIGTQADRQSRCLPGPRLRPADQQSACRGHGTPKGNPVDPRPLRKTPGHPFQLWRGTTGPPETAVGTATDRSGRPLRDRGIRRLGLALEP